LLWDDEVTPEDEEEMIRNAAENIHKYGMDVPAIMMLETVKPLVYIGGQMGLLFISPFLPIFGENVGRGGEKFFATFEKRENVEKLIRLLEKKDEEEDPERLKEEQATEETHPKKGWRRFLPF